MHIWHAVAGSYLKKVKISIDNDYMAARSLPHCTLGRKRLFVQ
jgi:hypothetical protein